MWEIKINEFFYNPDSIFGIIFECIGEAPALIPFCYLAFVLVGLIFNKWDVRKNKRQYLALSCYLLLTLVITATIVEVLKISTNRMRFCDLGSGYEGYTPFYKAGEGGRSFPSGHASMSALSLLLVDLNEMHAIFKNKVGLYTFSLLFTLLVILSRLIMGAHYLTDLLFGVLISLFVRLLTRKSLSFLQRKSL